MANFMQPSPQRLRHKIPMANPKIKIHHPPKKTQRCITPPITTRHCFGELSTFLSLSYKVTHLYCSSPLTCPTHLAQYNSLHNRDIIFYLSRHEQSSKWEGKGVAHPQDSRLAIEANHSAQRIVKEANNNITIVIFNHQKGY